MKQFATKEEKAAYYKARQQKENARREKRETADRYDIEANPLNLDLALLEKMVELDLMTMAGYVSSTRKIGEMLAADGQVSQRFWSEWKGQDAYGFNKGEASFKAQVKDQGLGVARLSDGRWTLTADGKAILS